MPYYRGLGWKEGDLPNAEDYYRLHKSAHVSNAFIEEQDFVILK